MAPGLRSLALSSRLAIQSGRTDRIASAYALRATADESPP